MNTKKLTFMSMLSACALIIFMIESQIPPLLPIPGIKIGLANVITLIAISLLGGKEAFIILIIRIILGSIFTGNLMSFTFSFSGGILAFAAIYWVYKISKNILAAAIFGALLHNIGQIVVAVLFSSTPEILWYLPPLILLAIFTGTFTGIISKIVVNRLKDIKL